MAALVLECAIRAALVAFGTAAVLRLMRVRRAATRHAAWTAVVVVMLGLPFWSIGGPKLPVPLLHARAAGSEPASTPLVAGGPRTTLPATVSRTSETAASPIATARSAGTTWARVLAAIYLLGAVFFLSRLCWGTLYLRTLRRHATVEEGHATTDRCAAPITIGWLAPMPILPAGWQRWPPAKLDAVLKHEGEHARRRDPLVQWIALFNRSIFWFHPLAWWLERRLATLAEESCDAAVLAAGHSPADYCEYLLEFARSIASDRGRIHVAAMAMPGSGLSERIRQILDPAPRPHVSRTRLAGITVLCAASTAVFAAVSPTPRPSPPPPPAQAAPAAKPAFDAATVRPCEATADERARRSDGRRIEYTAHRLYFECFTVDRLVNFAYVRKGEYRLTEDLERQVRGGPDWIRSERYTVEATIPDAHQEAALTGQMLQRLLEDTFTLRAHGMSEDVPMYALTVAKGGLKIKRLGEGGCVEDDSGQVARVTPGTRPPCGIVQGTRKGQMRVWDLGGASLADLVTVLDADRQILDQTGVTGRFNIHLEYTPDAADPAAERGEFAGPTLSKALEEQLGLKLMPITGPHEYVVIDRIERPTAK